MILMQNMFKISIAAATIRPLKVHSDIMAKYVQNQQGSPT